MLMTAHTLKSIYPPDLRWNYRRYDDKKPNGLTGKYHKRLYLWCKQFLKPTKADVKRLGGRGFPAGTNIRVLCPSGLDISGGIDSTDIKKVIFAAQPTPDGGLFHRNKLWNIITDVNWRGEPWFHVPIDNLVDVTEQFWEGYQKIGICFIDRKHVSYTRHRLQFYDENHSLCLFCGQEFEKHEYEIPQPPLRMVEWKPVGSK